MGSKQEVGRRKRGIFMMEMKKGGIFYGVPVLINEGFSDLLLGGFRFCDSSSSSSCTQRKRDKD